MLKTYKYRLYPTKAQEQLMFQTLNVCRNWYNMCLSERKLAYDSNKAIVTMSEQQSLGKQYRKTFPQASIVSAQTLQIVANDLDKAFQSFFRRVKAKQTAGYPRFKSWKQFDSFGFKQYTKGVKLSTKNKLYIYGIGDVYIKLHRPIPENSKIKTVRIIHKSGQWYSTFACELSERKPLEKTGSYIGIDVGITALATDSNGIKVDNPKYYRKTQKKLRILQRSLSRKPKGSNQRKKALKRVQQWHQHIVNQRSDYLHKLSHTLIQNNDGIAIENLTVDNMVRNHKLSKSILDSGWSIFKQYLTYKAESAGRELIFVDPAYTSQICPNCGKLEKIGLDVRWIDCECGLSIDRDHRAAINILKRSGWDASLIANVDHEIKRRLEASNSKRSQYSNGKPKQSLMAEEQPSNDGLPFHEYALNHPKYSSHLR